MTATRTSILTAVLYGGFVAGTIDIGSAAAINGISPLIILRAIASGLLGRAALQGGLPVAAPGPGPQWASRISTRATLGADG